MPEVEIISASTCPYAQRTKLALAEKGIAHKVTEVDLENKPDWFRVVSPYGKVPVLRHGDTAIWESAVINEYLEEVFPEPQLLPRTSAARAQARIWIDYANVRFAPFVYKLLLAQSPADRAERARLLRDSLLFVEREALGKRSEGPWFLGRRLSLVDLSFFPHFERLPAVAHYRGFEIPEECTRLRAWYAAMLNRPSVAALHQPDFVYIRNWRKYADNSGTGVTAEEMRRF